MRQLAFALSLLLSGAGLAEPRPDPASRTIAAAEKDRIICRTWAPIGSLIPNHKECRTKDDWDRMRLDTSHIVQGGSCNSAETGSCY